MARLGQYLDQSPRELQSPLDRLIGVGVHAKSDGRHPVAGPSQLAPQLLGRIGLVEKPGFEIEPRRETEEGMTGPGVAIDATVLAATVGVDGTIEGQIG